MFLKIKLHLSEIEGELKILDNHLQVGLILLMPLVLWNQEYLISYHYLFKFVTVSLFVRKTEMFFIRQPCLFRIRTL